MRVKIYGYVSKLRGVDFRTAFDFFFFVQKIIKFSLVQIFVYLFGLK